MHKWKIAGTVILAIVGVFFGAEHVQKVLDKSDLLELHNVARKSLPLLELNVDCDEAAQSHAEWMAAHNILKHEEGRNTVEDRLKKPWTVVGENIAKGQLTPAEVTADWLSSSGHRRNIQNKNFKYVGFGIATGKDGNIYWCAVFSN